MSFGPGPTSSGKSIDVNYIKLIIGTLLLTISLARIGRSRFINELPPDIMVDDCTICDRSASAITKEKMRLLLTPLLITILPFKKPICVPDRPGSLNIWLLSCVTHNKFTVVEV